MKSKKIKTQNIKSIKQDLCEARKKRNLSYYKRAVEEKSIFIQIPQGSLNYSECAMIEKIKNYLIGLQSSRLIPACEIYICTSEE